MLLSERVGKGGGGGEKGRNRGFMVLPYIHLKYILSQGIVIQ